MNPMSSGTPDGARVQPPRALAVFWLAVLPHPPQPLRVPATANLSTMSNTDCRKSDDD
jgi:hypothetical protein